MSATAPTVRKVFVLLSSTFFGLICGTTYLYSSYSPQYADRLGYTAADSSKIAQFGTIGVALAGPLSGKVVDRKGYTWPLVIGALAILCGYLGMKKQFDYQHASLSMSYVLFLLIGSGSTFINAACLKCCAVTFPSIRGVATAFPLALYGLSALFFSVIASIFFPGDTARFLGFLGYSSLVIFLICAPSIILMDREHKLRKQAVRQQMASSIEMNTLRPLRSGTPQPGIVSLPASPGHIHSTEDTGGTALFWSPRFWFLFVVTGLLAGMGQMYIYSVGYIVKALIAQNVDFESLQTEAEQALETTIQTNQSLQVGMISVTNCVGRLVAGIFGDIVTQSFNKRRAWLLYVPALGLLVTQLMVYETANYQNLGAISLLTGFFYGFTFCIMPIIVGDTFGMENFSMNWGLVCLSPILPSFYFTNLFGKIFDSHSTGVSTGLRVCTLGKDCYNSIFVVTSVVSIVCVVVVTIFNVGYDRLSTRPHLKAHT